MSKLERKLCMEIYTYNSNTQEAETGRQWQVGCQSELLNEKNKGEMPLPGKHEDLSSDPQHPHKKLGACKYISGEVETGKSLGIIHQPTSLTEQVNSRFIERPCIKN